MNKKILAIAVAGALVAPFAAQADATVYGIVHNSIDKVDQGQQAGGTTTSVTAATRPSDNWQVNDRASRVGVKGSEDLGGGLKAIYQLEWQVDTADANGAGSNISSRNQFVGLAGGWGTFLFGRHDTPYKVAGSADVFGDTAADAQATGGIIGRGGWDKRANNAIAYISPSMNGLTLAAAVIPGEDATPTTATANAKTGDGLADAYSLAAIYGNGPFKFSLGYEKVTSSFLGGGATSDAADIDALKVNLGYNGGNWTVGFTWEDADQAYNSTANGGRDGDDKVVSQNRWLLTGTYNFGNNVLKAAYGDVDHKTATDVKDSAGVQRTVARGVERFSIGIDHKFSARTTAYVLYTQDDFDRNSNEVTDQNTALGTNQFYAADDTDTISFGLKHSF